MIGLFVPDARHIALPEPIIVVYVKDVSAEWTIIVLGNDYLFTLGSKEIVLKFITCNELYAHSS